MTARDGNPAVRIGPRQLAPFRPDRTFIVQISAWGEIGRQFLKAECWVDGNPKEKYDSTLAPGFYATTIQSKRRTPKTALYYSCEH